MIIPYQQYALRSTHHEQRTPSHGDLAIYYLRFTIYYFYGFSTKSDGVFIYYFLLSIVYCLLIIFVDFDQNRL